VKKTHLGLGRTKWWGEPEEGGGLDNLNCGTLTVALVHGPHLGRTIWQEGQLGRGFTKNGCPGGRETKDLVWLIYMWEASIELQDLMYVGGE